MQNHFAVKGNFVQFQGSKGKGKGQRCCKEGPEGNCFR